MKTNIKVAAAKATYFTLKQIAILGIAVLLLSGLKKLTFSAFLFFMEWYYRSSNEKMISVIAIVSFVIMVFASSKLIGWADKNKEPS